MSPSPKGKKKTQIVFKPLQDQSNHQRQNNPKTLTSKKDALAEIIEKAYRTPLCEGKVKLNVAQFLKSNNADSMSNAFRRHWKMSGLEEMKRVGLSYSVAKQAYATYLQSQKQKISERNQKNKSFKIFIDIVDNDVDSVSHQVITESTIPGTTASIIEGDSQELLATPFEQVAWSQVNLVEICGSAGATPTTKECQTEPLPQSINLPQEVSRLQIDTAAEFLGAAVVEDSSDSNKNEENEQFSSFEGTTSDKSRVTKLSKEEMGALIAEYYCQQNLPTIDSFLTPKGKFSNRNAFRSHWQKSGLQALRNSPSPEPLVTAIEIYYRWCQAEEIQKAEINRKNGAKEKALPVEFETFMAALVRIMAMFGHGLSKNIVRQIIESALVDFKEDENDIVVSRRTVERFMFQYNLGCKNMKSIDPARIDQVTEANRDGFYALLDSVVGLVHQTDPINCPWTNWADVPASNKYNMDEFGTDPTKHKNTIVLPKDLDNIRFQSTPEGDRMAFHCTVVAFSRGDGHYRDHRHTEKKIDGAPMPMIIHSKGQSKDKRQAREKRMALYQYDEYTELDDRYLDGFDAENPLDIVVRTSPNGSMTKELFLDMSKHFTKNLPSSQGKKGEFCFKLLDNHVSRWNPLAMLEYFRNRVVPCYLPSHLSICIQPQDNGVIRYHHHCIANAADIPRLMQFSTSIEMFNTVLSTALTSFLDGEWNALRDHGSNATTGAWERTGLEPSDPNSSGWRDALSTFGIFNKLKINNDEKTFYHVYPKHDDSHIPFSENEIDLLDAAVPNKQIEGEEIPELTVLDNPLSKCYTLNWRMIDRWVEAEAKDREPVPSPETPAERVATRYFDIRRTVIATRNGSSIDEPVASTEAWKAAKAKALVSTAKKMDVIEARPSEPPSSSNNYWFNANKLESGNWLVVDGEGGRVVTDDELLGKNWIVNPDQRVQNDEQTRERRKNSHRRKKREEQELRLRIATITAENIREEMIVQRFDRFNCLSKEQRTLERFDNDVRSFIETPSDHDVVVDLNGSKQTFAIAAFGKNKSAAVDHLVTTRICRTIIDSSKEREKTRAKKKGKKGRVNRVKRGSDGFQKKAQMDEQFNDDTVEDEDSRAASKAATIAKLKSCLQAEQEFSNDKERLETRNGPIWNDDNELMAEHITGASLIKLLQFFSVPNYSSAKTVDAKRGLLRDQLITQQAYLRKKEELQRTLDALTDNLVEEDQEITNIVIDSNGGQEGLDDDNSSGGGSNSSSDESDDESLL